MKTKILSSIGQIFDQAADCRLEPSFFNLIDNELVVISEYFNTSKIQSFFIAMIFSLNYKGNTVDLNDLTSHFECNPMRILEFSDEFDQLHARGILTKHKSMHHMKISCLNEQYMINEKITEAILKNKACPSFDNCRFDDYAELLEKVHSLGEQRDDEEISTSELFRKSQKLIISNLHIPMIKKVNDFGFDISDTYLYLYLVWKTLSGNESTDLGRAMEGIFDKPSERIRNMQKIYCGENILVKNELMELEESNFINQTQIKLSEKSIEILNELGIKLFSKKKKRESVLSPENIPMRRLFFDEDKMKPLVMLKKLLKEEQLSETQKRLTDKKLPKGINILFYGLPGTGKTETALQMAKYTNREIMKVEISQSKSMWYGESEKIIKKIFTDYKSFSKECERTPILLFNEADAILSSRKQIGSSNLHQTENAIQNILLEELENFEGILIATTNLASNLDKAFDRRFLFKVEFQKPDTRVKSLIWKFKLPGLDIMDYDLLASEFDFSGGQIDNIVRKSEIHEIIHGVQVDLKSVLEFCREEILGKNTGKIGFSLS